MENPLEKVEAAISHKLSSVAHHGKQPIHNRIQAILYQEMTNENMEKALTEVTEKILISLFKRYWYFLVLGIVGLLGLQIVMVKVLINSNCSNSASNHSAGQ